MAKEEKFKRRKFRQETFFHSYLVRPAAQEICILVWNTKITPNQLTFFRVLLNILSLYFFIENKFLVGFILFQIHEIIDHADGMLARLKGIRSEVGAVSEVICDTLFSTVFGFMGFSFAVAGYRLTNNPKYFVIFGLISMSYCFGSYLSKVSSYTKDSPHEGIHMNHDSEEYLSLFPGSMKKMLTNWIKTAYSWQNQFLLWGGVLYFPFATYGIDSLWIGFIIVFILTQAYWINVVVHLLKRAIKSLNC